MHVQPADSPQFRESLEAVQLLVNAKSWEETMQIISTHNDALFADQATEAFAMLEKYFADSPLVFLRIEEDRALVVGSRAEGIDTTFTRYEDLQTVLEELFGLEGSHNIQRRIEVCHAALRLIDRKLRPRMWGWLMQHLAGALMLTRQGDRVGNMERAIGYYKEALRTIKPDWSPEQWAAIHNDLGVMYRTRKLDDPEENLADALRHLEMALQVFRREAFPEQWARVQVNIGLVYSDFSGGQGSEVLDAARFYYEQSLEVYSRDRYPEEWAHIQLNLGYAYVRLAGDTHFDQAITHFESALQVSTPDSFPELWAQAHQNLGAIYRLRDRGQRSGDLIRSIEHYQQALLVFSLEDFPAEHREILSHLADVYFTQHNWHIAQTAYEQAIEADMVLFKAAYTEGSRQVNAAATSHLYAHSAYCLLQLGLPDEALLQLERGKARSLNYALSVEEIETSMLPDDLQHELSEARGWHHKLAARLGYFGWDRGQPDPQLNEHLQHAKRNLDQLVERIRREYPDSMPGDLEVEGILRLVPSAGALVVPLITAQGSVVFAIPDGAEAVTADCVIPLEQQGDDFAKLLLFGSADQPGWLYSYAEWLSEGSLNNWQDGIQHTTALLWALMMGLLHERLQSMGISKGASITISLQGGLALLPLHAASREMDGTSHHFCEDYIVSYTPSLHALATCRRRLQQDQRHRRSLLAVVNRSPDLPYTPIECEAIAPFFPIEARSVLIDETDKWARFVSGAQSHAYLHFACHGFYDWQEPTRSGLLLGAGTMLPFTLADVLTFLFLRETGLVTLSACETGMTEFHASPDEYIGLPAGFLAAGAPAVISSLWSVDDLSAAILMKEFYRRHLVEGVSVPSALWGAQLWLLDATADELGLAAMWRYVYESSGQRDTAAFRAQRYYLAHPEEKPFRHPYYWAGFVFTGASAVTG